MKKEIVTLNTYDFNLQGKFRSGNDVKVFCDATEGDFSINLVDAQSAIDTIFTFIRVDEIRDYIVTLNTILGQTFKNESSQKLRVGSAIVCTSDGFNYFTG